MHAVLLRNSKFLATQLFVWISALRFSTSAQHVSSTETADQNQKLAEFKEVRFKPHELYAAAGNWTLQLCVSVQLNLLQTQTHYSELQNKQWGYMDAASDGNLQLAAIWFSYVHHPLYTHCRGFISPNSMSLIFHTPRALCWESVVGLLSLSELVTVFPSGGCVFRHPPAVCRYSAGGVTGRCWVMGGFNPPNRI